MLVYNAAVLRGRWSGVEWAVWQGAVELSRGKTPKEFVFLVADGVRLPAPLPGGRIVRLPRYVGTRIGRIFYELLLMPRLIRSLLQSRAKSETIEPKAKSSHLLSVIRHPSSVIRDVGGRDEAGVTARFVAPAYVAPPRLPCPFTLHLYDLHVYTHPRFCTWLNRLHYRWRIPGSVCRAETIVVPSQHVLGVLVRLFPEAAGKARVMPPALPDRFRPASSEAVDELRARLGLPARYLLFVGEPTPRKNLPAALAAWRTLRAEPGNGDLGFVLAGGRCRTPRADDVADAPVHVGYVAAADMPALYTGAAALVYPSFDEGYGLPIAEARACGCPVVTSAPTACEVAPDAFTCGTDAPSIAAALRRALFLRN